MMCEDLLLGIHCRYEIAMVFQAFFLGHWTLRTDLLKHT